MEENKEIFRIDSTDYTVITNVENNGGIEEVYNILVRYALEKINEEFKNNN